MSSINRALADFRRVGAGDAAVFLSDFEVFGPSIVVFDAPARTLLDDVAKFLARQFQKTVAADASRHALEEKIDNFFQARLYVVAREVCDDQTHAAVDVESNAAGRDHTALVHIHGRNAADGESVAAVAVGHAKRVARDARQRGDVANLLVNGFVHFAHELFCRDDPRRHAHALFVSHRYFPDGIRDFSHFVDDAHVNCVLTKDRFQQLCWMIRLRTPRFGPPVGVAWSGYRCLPRRRLAVCADRVAGCDPALRNEFTHQKTSSLRTTRRMRFMRALRSASLMRNTLNIASATCSTS